MKNANVQNLPIFTVDLADFTVALTSENHQKIFEKLCSRARVGDPPKPSQKSPSKSSKMAPKSMKNQCWKPSKSVFNVFKLFESLKIDFLTVFITFASQMGPKMDPQMTPKSIKNQSRGLLASRKGPPTAQEPSGTPFWSDF